MRTAKQEGGSRSVLLAGIGYAIDAKGCWLRCVWSRTVIVYIEREIYPACSSLYTSLLFCGSDRKDRSRISHVVICPDADAYDVQHIKAVCRTCKPYGKKKSGSTRRGCEHFSTSSGKCTECTRIAADCVHDIDTHFGSRTKAQQAGDAKTHQVRGDRARAEAFAEAERKDRKSANRTSRQGRTSVPGRKIIPAPPVEHGYWSLPPEDESEQMQYSREGSTQPLYADAPLGDQSFSDQVWGDTQCPDENSGQALSAPPGMSLNQYEPFQTLPSVWEQPTAPTSQDLGRSSLPKFARKPLPSGRKSRR